MRIIGGALGGRLFRGPPPSATRPTADRVREAIASALMARSAIEGARVLDLYAGTGAFAFEALSRGAERAVCVEREKRVAAAIETSATELGLRARVEVIVGALGVSPRAEDRRGRAQSSGPLEQRLRRAAGSDPFDLVFADPPYADIDDVPPLLQRLAALGVIARGALVVLEHATKQPPKSATFLATEAAYRYGDTAVLFARITADTETPPP